MALGVIGALLSNPKTTPKYFDLGIKDAVPDYLGRLKAGGAASDAGLIDYARGLDTAAGRVRGFEDMDIATLGNMLRKGSNRDFLGDYRSALGIGVDAFDRVSDTMSGYNSRFDKQLAFDLGYGNKPTNSYLTKVSADRQSKNAVPLLQTIFGGAPSVAGMAQNAWMQNLGSALNLMEQRAAIPYRGTGNPLAVINARDGVLNSGLGQFGALGEIARTNVAGFETKDNKWANAFKEAQREGEALTNMAMQAAAAYFGGGMGGMGGMMGGAGAPTATAAGSPAITATPSFYTPTPMSYSQPSPSPMNYPPAANWATQAPPWYAPGFGWNSGY